MADPFISRDDLAAALYREAGSLDSDELAVIAVDAACDAVRDFTGQEINRVEADTAIFSGDGKRKVLTVPQLPAEIDEVRVRATPTSELEVLLEWVAFDGGMIRLTSGADWAAWPKGDANIEVDYAHGWAAADIPRSIRLVALMVATRIYQQGVARQESTGSSSISYSVAAAADLSSGERAILAKHRSIKRPTVAAVPAVS